MKLRTRWYHKGVGPSSSSSPRRGGFFCRSGPGEWPPAPRPRAAGGCPARQGQQPPGRRLRWTTSAGRATIRASAQPPAGWHGSRSCLQARVRQSSPSPIHHTFNLSQKLPDSANTRASRLGYVDDQAELGKQAVAPKPSQDVPGLGACGCRWDKPPSSSACGAGGRGGSARHARPLPSSSGGQRGQAPSPLPAHGAGLAHACCGPDASAKAEQSTSSSNRALPSHRAPPPYTLDFPGHLQAFN